MKVAVFGLGYVGTVTAAGLAHCGHSVVGVDVDDAKVASINAGESPVVEPGIVELIATGAQSGRLRATTSASEAVEHADLSLICVGTPSGSHGSTDLSYIERVAADIREAMTHGRAPGVRASTRSSSGAPSPRGRSTTSWPRCSPSRLRRLVRSARRCARSSCARAAASKDFFAPPFVVVGPPTRRPAPPSRSSSPSSTSRPATSPSATAEALKYACNAFHATKVSFANEIARVFRGYGVDSREVMEIFCEDTKLNISPTYLRPGFAFGGSCLPKDLRVLQYMARMSGVDAAAAGRDAR